MIRLPPTPCPVPPPAALSTLVLLSILEHGNIMDVLEEKINYFFCFVLSDMYDGVFTTAFLRRRFSAT